MLMTAEGIQHRVYIFPAVLQMDDLAVQPEIILCFPGDTSTDRHAMASLLTDFFQGIRIILCEIAQNVHKSSFAYKEQDRNSRYF